MEQFYEFIRTKKIACISILLGITTLIMSGLYFKEANASEAFHCPTESEIEVLGDTDTMITADIKGAVKNPGVYVLEEGSRVNDLIKKAGGLLSNADTENINLSKTLENEMVIIISTIEELKDKVNAESDATIKPDISNGILSDGNAVDLTSKVSLNKASLEELLTLTGIGEAKAQAIIQYRSTCGEFKKIEDVKNISGIGEAIYEKIKDRLTL